MSLTPEQLLSAQEWNKLIESNVTNAIGSKLDGDFVAANNAAGFHFDVKQIDYNADFLADLDLLVSDTDDVPTLGNSFSSLYRDVINNLTYELSSEDMKMIDQEKTRQSALAGKICSLYAVSELDEDPVDHPSIMYIMNRISEVTGTNYLQVNMQKYPSLDALCSHLPIFAEVAVFTAKMVQQMENASKKLNAIAEHIEKPSETNGALKTGAAAWNIAWDSLPETTQLLSELKSSSSIGFSVSVSDLSSSSSTVSYTNDISAKVPFNWFFNMKVGASESCDLAKYAREDSSLKIEVTFKGVTTLAAVPGILSEDNEAGWYALNILQEASEKSGKDATGYKLHGSEFNPTTLFGKNGKLRRMKTFVISQQPSIYLEFKNVDSESMQEIFSTKTEVSFSFLGGLISGDSTNGYMFEDYQYNSETQTLSVKIEPAAIDDSDSLEKQTAFILGGVQETY